MQTRKTVIVIGGLLSAVALPAQRRPLTVEPLSQLAHRPTASRLRPDPVTKKLVPYAVNGSRNPEA